MYSCVYIFVQCRKMSLKKKIHLPLRAFTDEQKGNLEKRSWKNIFFHLGNWQKKLRNLERLCWKNEKKWITRIFFSYMPLRASVVLCIIIHY